MATKRKGKDQLEESKAAKKQKTTHDETPAATAATSAPGKAVVTKLAPDFSGIDAVAPDGSFSKVSLKDYAGKYLVVFFYPLDFTFVCPTEIIEFSDKYPEFKKIGCEVLGVSCDSQFSHLAWTEQARNKGGLGKLNIPLVADLKRTMSTDYGVLLDDGHPLRGLFIIDGKGVLRFLSHNDPPVGRNVDEVLRLVAAYQFTDEHGEVCPAGWKPGKATIKADPTDKLEFFKKAYDESKKA